MAKTALTLDLRAHTSRALSEFKTFSNSLENKFFISGLKVDLLRQTLSDINREFDKAMGNEGMKTAMELKQLETGSAAVFSVLKGGSLEAGREMAKNIREALGDVSKTIGSTNEDINAVMRMVPYTSKHLLDKAGVSMEDFHSKNLEMITNARDAMGEDASKILEGLLSGTTTQTDLLNDRSGIGQMIRTQVGAFDPSAMSPEARTEKVLKILQNDDFQQVLSGLAEDNAGFMKIVRSFRNTLFDSRTGVFGILKESTLSLREFSGERVIQTTSLFEETTRLFRVVFDLQEGLFARLFKTLGEVFGFNSSSFTDTFIRIVRWVSNTLNSISEFFASPDFRNFVEGIKGIIDFFVEGAKGLSALTGLSPQSVAASIQTFVGGIGNILKSISEGDWGTAANTASAGIQEAAAGLVNNLQTVTQNITKGNTQLSLSGGLAGAAVGSMIAPGIGTAVGAGVGAALGEDTLIEIAVGVKDITIGIVDGTVKAASKMVKDAGGWEAIGVKFSEFINNLGGVIVDGLKGITEKLTNKEFDASGLLKGMGKVFEAIINQGFLIVNELINSLIALRASFGDDGFKEIGRVLAKIFKAAVPLLVKGLGFVLNVIEDVFEGFIQEMLSFLPEPIRNFVAAIGAKLVLIFNPGGIITKILGRLPLIGKLLTPLYNLLTLNFKELLPRGTYARFARVFANFGRNAFNALVGWANKTVSRLLPTFANGGALNFIQTGLLSVSRSILAAARRGFGRFFQRLSIRAGFSLTSILPNAVSKVGGMLPSLARKLLQTIVSAFKNGAIKALAKIPVIGGLIDFAMNLGSGDSTTRAATRAGTGMGTAALGAAAGTAVFPGVGTVIGGVLGGLAGNEFLGKWVADRFGATKFSGNIPEYARASNGLNMLAAAASREQENIRPGANPVIANSDEIIIPPGRLAEIRLVSNDQIKKSLKEEFPRLENQTVGIIAKSQIESNIKTQESLNSFSKNILQKLSPFNTTVEQPQPQPQKIEYPAPPQEKQESGILTFLSEKFKQYLGQFGRTIDYQRLSSIINSPKILEILALINSSIVNTFKQNLRKEARKETDNIKIDYTRLAEIFNNKEVVSLLKSILTSLNVSSETLTIDYDRLSEMSNVQEVVASLNAIQELLTQPRETPTIDYSKLSEIFNTQEINSSLGGIQELLSAPKEALTVDYDRLSEIFDIQEVVTSLNIIQELLTQPRETPTIDYGKLSEIFNIQEVVASLSIIQELLSAPKETFSIDYSQLTEVFSIQDVVNSLNTIQELLNRPEEAPAIDYDRFSEIVRSQEIIAYLGSIQEVLNVPDKDFSIDYEKLSEIFSTQGIISSLSLIQELLQAPQEPLAIDYDKLLTIFNTKEVITSLNTIRDSLDTPEQVLTIDYDRLAEIFNTQKIISSLGMIQESINAPAKVHSIDYEKLSEILDSKNITVLLNTINSSILELTKIVKSQSSLGEKTEVKKFIETTSPSQNIQKANPELDSKKNLNENLLNKYLLDITSENKNIKESSASIISPLFTTDLNQSKNPLSFGPSLDPLGRPDGFNKLGESITKYGEESENVWQKSTDTASTFFKEFEYKTGVEWKNNISKPLSVSAPTVSVDSSAINKSISDGLSGVNFGEIISKVPEGMSEGWKNINEFFVKTGDRAKELLENNIFTQALQQLKNVNPLRGITNPFSPQYAGNKLNTASSGFNLAGFTEAAEREVLNTGVNSNLVVANDTEIIAPKSSLNQLASLLIRQHAVKNSPAASPQVIEVHNVFHITGSANPEEIADLVMQRMDTVLSHKMMNNRVPHA